MSDRPADPLATFWDHPLLVDWLARITGATACGRDLLRLRTACGRVDITPSAAFGRNWATVTTPTGLEVVITVDRRTGKVRLDPHGVIALPENIGAIRAAIVEFEQARRSAMRRPGGLATAAAKRARADALKEATHD